MRDQNPLVILQPKASWCYMCCCYIQELADHTAWQKW